MKKRLARKAFVSGIILLLFGISVISSVTSEGPQKKYEFLMIPTTWYVDDDNYPGPGNGTLENPFCKIQYGIDNASNGDAIYVFNGTYYENVVIDVSIHLMGENKNSTIIDGGGNDTTLIITADRVILNSFTIENNPGTSGGLEGIKITSNNNMITGNNIIAQSMEGILLSSSDYNNITQNTITDCYCGIYLFDSDNNTIAWNTIPDTNVGIQLSNSRYNVIVYNNITGALKNCMYLDRAVYNKILNNNLISYVKFPFAALTVSCSISPMNTWDGNYWDGRWEVWFGHNILVRTLPRPIYGQMNFLLYLNLPWINFDKHQAKEPYGIP